MPDLDDDTGAAGDVSDADADSAAPDAQPTSRSRMSGGFIAAVTLAVVFFVTTVVFAVLAAGERSENEELTGEREDVSTAAGQLMDALLRFDHERPEATREAVLALSAAQFRSQYEDAFEANAALWAEFEMVTTPAIEDVFVGDIEDDQATAIVRYDRIIETSERTNTETGFYAEVELARIDGRWLVTNVFNINFALGGGPGDLGSESTTTTAAPGS